jgi:DNA primase
MTINLLQAKNIIDEHLGSSTPHKKDGEVSYYCPFCNHYKRKLQVNLSTQKWHCWVCNSKGQTLTSLLKKSNAPIQSYQKIKEVCGEAKTNVRYEPGRELIGLPENYKPLHINHGTPDYRNALHYALNIRKLTPIDILRYQVGYCEEGPYAGMIIIPSYNEHNNINYYVGRSFYNNAVIKHKNPPVSKDVIGFENQINWKEPVVIVEGAFDAIATKRNAIPLFGKGMHPNLKNKIIKNVKKLYLALDKDAFVDSLKYVELYMNNGIEVYIVNLPGKDPSELGYAGMVECLQKADKVDFLKLMTMRLSLQC